MKKESWVEKKRLSKANFVRPVLKRTKREGKILADAIKSIFNEALIVNVTCNFLATRAVETS